MIDNYPSSSIPKIYLNEIKLILGLLLAKQESDLTTKLAKVNKIGALDVIDEIYNHELLKLDDSPFMKQNADFQEGISQT